MKRLITIILVLISLGTYAQTFKPTVKKITLDSINARTNNVYINDPLIVQDTTLIDLIKFHGGTGSTVNFGTDGQVPFMNLAGSDFQYSDNFKWNDTTLTINSGSNNNFIGIDAGKYILNGSENVMIGNYAGCYNTNGYANTFIGYETGFGNISGNTNTFIGYRAGYSNITGLGNVFIGVYSGYSETGSNKLYIENSNIATPLIYGDFANDTVRINGTLEVTGMLDHSASANMPKIYSQATEPDIPNNTTAYWIDTDDSKYYLILDFGGTQKKTELL